MLNKSSLDCWQSVLLPKFIGGTRRDVLAKGEWDETWARHAREHKTLHFHWICLAVENVSVLVCSVHNYILGVERLYRFIDVRTFR